MYYMRIDDGSGSGDADDALAAAAAAAAAANPYTGNTTTCADDIKNGMETAVDCGGGQPVNISQRALLLCVERTALMYFTAARGDRFSLYC